MAALRLFAAIKKLKLIVSYASVGLVEERRLSGIGIQ
jgi:hypothetical protein